MARVAREVCLDVTRILARVICIIVIGIQGGLIDYYLVIYASSSINYSWLGWIAADVVNCVLFIITLVVSYKMIHGSDTTDGNRHGRMSKGMLCLTSLQGNKASGELPLGYIAWGIYSILLVTRLAIFFKTGAAELKEELFFGPNMMKTAIGLSAFVFLFLVLSSSSAKAHSDQAMYIEKLIGSTTLDILDSVEFLEVLFLQESRIFLTFDLWNSILAFSCINLMLPTVPLLVLSHTRFGRFPVKRAVKIVHSLLFIVLINVPFLAIRLYLWHVLSRDISVFIVKNAIMTLIGFKEIFELSEDTHDEADGQTHPQEDEEHFEMSAEQPAP